MPVDSIAVSGAQARRWTGTWASSWMPPQEPPGGCGLEELGLKSGQNSANSFFLDL